MPSWSGVLKEIAEEAGKGEARMLQALETVRRKHLKNLSDYTGRNTIAYYSSWLTKKDIMETDIGDEDMNGFMEVIHGLDRSKGLDLMLHTPGGDLAATEAISHYVRKTFDKNVRAIIPQIAMSGGTILACGCEKIIMGEHSALGPIDPQIGGIPASGLVEEFEQACNDVKQDSAKLSLWQFILNKYYPTLINQCGKAIAWSKEIVQKQLVEVMLRDENDKEEKAKHIAEMLSDNSKHKSHSRHIHIDELRDAGLRVARLEDDNELQNLVLTVHHAYTHTFIKGPSVKIIENQNKAAWIENVAPTS